MTLSPIGLVIFDLDGVLVDACEWHRAALNKALKEACNYEITTEDHYELYNGLPTRVKLEILGNKGIIDISLAETIEKLKQKFTLEVINQESKIQVEKIELLQFLKQKGILVGCYTNSIRQTAELMLKTTGVLPLIDKLVTNLDVKKPKPDPEGYELCMKHFNFTGEQTLIVEDSPYGIESAKKSGAKCLEVNNAKEVNVDLLKNYLYSKESP
jgi:HAD superfamily hydrolase (TIGR01509 family)